MPGMHGGVTTSNPVLIAAFRTALMHQGLIALLVLTSLAIIWASLREWRPSLVARAAGRPGGDSEIPAGQVEPEPAAHSLARISFGLLWVLDGILQAQPAMPAGLESQVVAPAAATSPSWVQHAVNWSGTAWSYHPIQASTSAVWIQVGIGIWLLAAPRGRWSRLSGLASAAWGLGVWVFGEAFGGIFGPGVSVLFGAPGAALFYSVAGVLLALPERYWRTPALGQWLLRGLGAFFVGMAFLQAWPGRGFWQGMAHGRQGSLTSMVSQMSGTPQPAIIGHLVGDFASFTASHGSAVNAFAVAALLIIGLGLLGPRRQLLRPVVIAAAVFCLADWGLVQDFGLFGGLGTDPNSMVPLLLLVICGYLGVTRTEPAPASDKAPAWSGWRKELQPLKLATGFASTSAVGILAIWAAAVVLLGAAPMALAQANPNADPIIAKALGGSTAAIDIPASPFQLTSENGQPVSLASLRGRVVLLTFLDPVCNTDCPLIAQELKATDQMLGANASRVEIVAITANLRFYSRPYLRAFERRERLTGMRNFVYLTGSLRQLRQVWGNYGETVTVVPGQLMSGHSDIVFVIDALGHIRAEINSDPGPGTASSKSSFAVEFSQAVERVLVHAASSS